VTTIPVWKWVDLYEPNVKARGDLINIILSVLERIRCIRE
jgi:hypothetical protein